MNTFKLAGDTSMPIQKTDRFVNNYLDARKSHFRVLVTQYFSIIGFKVFVTAGLLILGGLLVIDQQINLGQFIAAEIIIILILNSIEKIIMSLDSIYDI